MWGLRQKTSPAGYLSPRTPIHVEVDAMTGREKMRLRWEAVKQILAEYGTTMGLIIVYRWGESSRGYYVGKGIRLCEDITNAQIFTTYVSINGCMLQIGYRFRRRTLRKLLPHPQILAG